MNGIYFTSHKPDQGKKLSVKSRLILIAIMFIVINLIFYFGFDSSEESEENVQIEDQNQIIVEQNERLDQDISISPNLTP